MGKGKASIATRHSVTVAVVLIVVEWTLTTRDEIIDYCVTA